MNVPSLSHSFVPAGAVVGMQPPPPSAHLHAMQFHRIPELNQLQRVFLLEDNDANAMVFEAFLESAGCMAMDRAESLEAAEFYIDGISNGLYDLVVIDIMLPDGESTAFSRRISQVCPCPIAAYTARTNTHDMHLYGTVGIQHVFAKPLSLEHFRAGLTLLDLG